MICSTAAGIAKTKTGGELPFRIEVLMKVHFCRIPRTLFLSLAVLCLFGIGAATTATFAQSNNSSAPATLTEDQQKQLNRFQQLGGQLQKDNDAVSSAAAKFGWDSDEADAAQQRLSQDRQEYRTLKQSLQRAGVSLPSDSGSASTAKPSSGGHCCHHTQGHHGCCGGDGHCADHDADCCGHGR